MNFPNSADIPLFIENIFPPKITRQAIDDGVYRLKDRVFNARDSELSLPFNFSQNYKDQMPDGFSHWAFDIDEGCKSEFAEWATKLDPEAFIYFDQIFDWLQSAANQEWQSGK